MAQSDQDRMRALEARIEAAKSKAAPETKHMDQGHSQAQLAWRMVVELVAGMGIGFGIGYGLDWALGTTPWFMIVFMILGFIAGVKTMIRSAQEVQQAAVTREEQQAAGRRGQTETQDGD